MDELLEWIRMLNRENGAMDTPDRAVRHQTKNQQTVSHRVSVPRGRRHDGQVEPVREEALKECVGSCLSGGEVDLTVCPKCGICNRERVQMDLNVDDVFDGACTVQFKLSKDLIDSGAFLYELACRMEGWRGVEVMSVQLGGYCYEALSSSED